MAKKKFASVPPAKHSTDGQGDGNALGNTILLSLSDKERNQVLSRLEFVRLELHHVLHEAGETIESGYFVNTGLISILAVQPDGKSVEVGLIGKEGLCRFAATCGLPHQPDQNHGPGRCDRVQMRCENSRSAYPTVPWVGAALASFRPETGDADYANRSLQSIA